MKLLAAFDHLFFPRICPGCGSDALQKEEMICPRCFDGLPFTQFHLIRDNKTEKTFYGRVGISFGMSLLYFSKNSIVQNLMHELKYKGNLDLGIFLGKMMGRALKKGKCFDDVDFVVPLPLSEKKKKRRGYNQAELLCDGIAEVIQKPVHVNKVLRTIDTATQTKKHRGERWRNVEGIFSVADPRLFENKHLLLVDDVLTTGATLEACATLILQSDNARVSIATLAIATK